MKTKVITHHRKLSATQQQDRCQQAAQKIIKLLVSVWLLIIASQAWALSYTITDLGTLSGTQSAGSDINNNGQIVGNSDGHAFLYENDVMKDLGTLGGNSSAAYGINNQGQVVGWTTYTTVTSNRHAFLYENGVMKDLGTLGGSWSLAYSINDNEQIVGWAYAADASGRQHAFLYENGVMKDLGTLGGTQSTANGINNNGQIVGQALTVEEYGHAFLYENRVMKDLGTLGGTWSAASDINDNGQIVGWAYTTDGTTRGFLYENGVMKDLGTLGGTQSTASGINNNGQVVGNSSYANGDDPYACLYSNGQTIDLNLLIPVGSGWMLHSTSGINDAGQITGAGYKGGKTHAFLLSPVFDLNIGRSGSGNGTITSEDGKINCGATCSASYDVRSIINLTAVPDVDSTFAGWSPTGCGTSFPIVGDTTCTANFDLAAPALSINNVANNEGNKGATNFTFTVTLSPASTQKVTVQYETADVAATAGYDYTSTSGTLTFKAGQTSKAVTVKVFGDKEKESDETFVVNLSNASKGASIRIGQGIGTILNDDGL